jgi:uncharacterized protein with FMN-binding domain
MNRTAPLAALTVAAIVPTVAAPAIAIGARAHAAAGKEYTGPTTRMRWGPVTVHIWVRGRRIVDVRSSLPTERPRSAMINDRAGPALRSETLKAQSARIHTISGATMSSRAFISSLRGALSKAHL